MPDITAFNTQGEADARAALLACCASPAFAAEVAAGRPYGSAAEVVAAAADAAGRLRWPEVREALAAHPRIGERAAGSGREASWSRGEQSGAADAGQDVRLRLAAGNLAYEERFGHVYLVCATGLTAAEMLGRLERRLGNDEESERRAVREELVKITRLRVAKLLEEDG
ncbi:2-oxo-4-hydroxy-4-carboxy-5-ureidoimidazoline decarboxylase [Streptosporangium sp. KLBMP 9127]|nr:2-oxo-4-hydroxy-4-carboxy-5-ureidoimidazoline decarboxylase [Streptosporangium sp. KLBMP 9127]